MDAHDLVMAGCWLVALDAKHTLVEELLDQLRSGRSIYNDDARCIPKSRLLLYCSLQAWEIQSVAIDMQKVEVLPIFAPSRAYTEVAQLGRFVGGIPTLDNNSPSTEAAPAPRMINNK